jgi:hypothetical protein
MQDRPTSSFSLTLKRVIPLSNHLFITPKYLVAALTSTSVFGFHWFSDSKNNF